MECDGFPKKVNAMNCKGTLMFYSYIIKKYYNYGL